MQECVKIEENTGKHEFEKKQKKTDRAPEIRKKKSLEHITLTSRKCEPLSHERNCFFMFSFNLALYVSRHIVGEKIMLFKP
jgi:hypothetical protein